MSDVIYSVTNEDLINDGYKATIQDVVAECIGNNDTPALLTRIPAETKEALFSYVILVTPNIREMIGRAEDAADEIIRILNKSAALIASYKRLPNVITKDREIWVGIEGNTDCQYLTIFTPSEY